MIPEHCLYINSKIILKLLEKVFKKALKIDRNFPLTHMNLGKAFSLVGNKTRAVLHTRYAEKIYLNNKDQKGLIEAKKQLKLLFK